MPRSRSESATAVMADAMREGATAERPARAAPPAGARKSRARVASAAPTTAPRKPRASRAPEPAAPVPQAAMTVEAPCVVETPAPPPSLEARQTPAAPAVSARVWAHVSAFARGPGRAALLVALKVTWLVLKATAALLAKLWGFAAKAAAIVFARAQAQLEAARRHAEPESLLPPRETPDAADCGDRGYQIIDAMQAMQLAGRIPPHQRHIYARMSSC
jgi:hypothetical protein